MFSKTKKLSIQVEIFDRHDIRFASGYPCTVSEVKPAIGSLCTRPMPGDILLQVNDINVSRTQAKAVYKLIKFVNLHIQIEKEKQKTSLILFRNLPLPITLQLYRRGGNPAKTTKIDRIVLNSVDQHQPLNSNMLSTNLDHYYSFSDTNANRVFCSSDKLTNNYDEITNCVLPETIALNNNTTNNNNNTDKQEQSLLMSPIYRQTFERNDENESGVGSESNPYSDGEQPLVR